MSKNSFSNMSFSCKIAILGDVFMNKNEDFAIVNPIPFISSLDTCLFSLKNTKKAVTNHRILLLSSVTAPSYSKIKIYYYISAASIQVCNSSSAASISSSKAPHRLGYRPTSKVYTMASSRALRKVPSQIPENCVSYHSTG